MADKNILRPAFGKKKPEPISTATSPAPLPPIEDESQDYKHIGPLTGEALARAEKDLMYMLTNSSFVQKMRDKLEKAGDFIFSLKNYTPSQESIKLRRQGLKTYSLEDICKEAEKTHELQWQSQPSYLGALTLEHHYRVQAAISIMPKDEESNAPTSGEI